MKSILITILFVASASSFAQTLSDRVTAARVQPTVEQTLIADLWASLQDAQSQLSSTQAALAASQASLAGTQQQVAADALVISSLKGWCSKCCKQFVKGDRAKLEITKVKPNLLTHLDC